MYVDVFISSDLSGVKQEQLACNHRTFTLLNKGVFGQVVYSTAFELHCFIIAGIDCGVGRKLDKIFACLPYTHFRGLTTHTCTCAGFNVFDVCSQACALDGWKSLFRNICVCLSYTLVASRRTPVPWLVFKPLVYVRKHAP